MGYRYSFIDTEVRVSQFLYYSLLVTPKTDYEFSFREGLITCRDREYTAEDIMNGLCEDLSTDVNRSAIAQTNIEAKYGRHAVWWNYAIRMEVPGGEELLNLRVRLRKLSTSEIKTSILWETTLIYRKMKQFIMRKYHYGE